VSTRSFSAAIADGIVDACATPALYTQSARVQFTRIVCVVIYRTNHSPACSSLLQNDLFGPNGMSYRGKCDTDYPVANWMDEFDQRHFPIQRSLVQARGLGGC
jgi:hypothetical protein